MDSIASLRPAGLSGSATLHQRRGAQPAAGGPATPTATPPGAPAGTPHPAVSTPPAAAAAGTREVRAVRDTPWWARPCVVGTVQVRELKHHILTTPRIQALAAWAAATYGYAAASATPCAAEAGAKPWLAATCQPTSVAATWALAAGVVIPHAAGRVIDWSWSAVERLRIAGLSPRQQLDRVVALANEKPLNAAGLRSAIERIRRLRDMPDSQITPQTALAAIAQLGRQALEPTTTDLCGLREVANTPELGIVINALLEESRAGRVSPNECAHALLHLACFLDTRFEARHAPAEICHDLVLPFVRALGSLTEQHQTAWPQRDRLSVLTQLLATRIGRASGIVIPEPPARQTPQAPRRQGD